VPAFDRGGAGMRWHLRPSAACGARVGAAESFVSFIPLFDGAVPPYSASAVLTITALKYSPARPPCANHAFVRPVIGVSRNTSSGRNGSADVIDIATSAN
jgi:hypothetical protein